MTQALGVMAAIGLDELLQYIVLFAIFILPGIKASRDAKKKKQQQSQRRQPASPPSPSPSAAPEPGKPSGAELWERLLRGEVDPAPPPVPAPAVQKRAATRRKSPEQPEQSKAKPRPQPIVREPLSAPMGDAKEFAELPRKRPMLPRAASENALETGASLEETLAHEQPFGRPLADSEVTGRQAYEPISIDASSSRDDWRRAIVLSEVLGTPVALRKSASSVPGLS